jgi:hypothetical protein
VVKDLLASKSAPPRLLDDIEIERGGCPWCQASAGSDFKICEDGGEPSFRSGPWRSSKLSSGKLELRGSGRE